ncbi:MAG: VCBS repeat-containing protein [Litoreibacter sp.]|nr:VCBS repeat-containing protein [Litoreibacter sp.]
MASVAGAHADIVGAEYGAPTDRYPHAVLGDDIEFGTLTLERRNADAIRFTLPKSRVFEDVAPRLFDLDGDGDMEVVVVESEAATGAQLAIYDETGKVAATPHIGTRFSWLAPIGAADLDGDGFVEIAYIDRPHLAKTLRVWRFKDGDLEPVASLPGLTNHRIGERDIGGGLRDCGAGPEMITASANWQKIMATRLVAGQLKTIEIGPHTGRASLRAALDCK